MGYKLTDKGNSERIADRLRAHLKYAAETDRWYIYNGKFWEETKGAEVYQAASKIMGELFAEADELREKALNEPEEREKLSATAEALEAWARNCESLTRRRAMVEGLKYEEGITIKLTDFDVPRHLLNCRNGTINLQTGKLQPHKATDLLSHCAPTEYAPERATPLWDRTLELVTGGNAELAGYLQRVFGYCITGEVREQAFFILDGNGQNGKSTVIEAVIEILGNSYAKAIDASLLLNKKFESHPTEVANLKGLRLGMTSETDAGRFINEGMIKKLTNKELSGRFMKQDFFTFATTHKLILDTNHIPSISGRDHGIWRRIKLVPFHYMIEERDPTVPERLRGEYAGILAWLVEGAKRWYAEGLGEPTLVTERVTKFKEDMDTLGEWIEEYCVVGPEWRESLSTLFASYREVMEDDGVRYPLGKKNFSQELEARGYTTIRSNGSIKVGIARKPAGWSASMAHAVAAAAGGEA